MPEQSDVDRFLATDESRWLVPGWGLYANSRDVGAGAGRALESVKSGALESLDRTSQSLRVLLIGALVLLVIGFAVALVIWARVGWELPKLLPAISEAFASGLL